MIDSNTSVAENNMSNDKLMYADKFVQPAGASTVPHCHNYYELTYHKSGHGNVFIKGVKHEFFPNHFVLISPFMEHYEYDETHGEKLYMNFYSEKNLPTGVFTDTQDIVLHLIETMYNETHSQYPLYEQMISAKLTELIVTLSRMKLMPLNNSCPKSFEYIINYISENYHEKIQMNVLAEQINYSYGYFQKRFKELIGESPQQFLIHKRIEAAKLLLKNSSLSCTEIAYRCGFSTSTQMSLIFKRETGISPLQYRKKI